MPLTDKIREIGRTKSARLKKEKAAAKFPAIDKYIKDNIDKPDFKLTEVKNKFNTTFETVKARVIALGLEDKAPTAGGTVTTSPEMDKFREWLDNKIAKGETSYTSKGALINSYPEIKKINTTYAYTILDTQKKYTDAFKFPENKAVQFRNYLEERIANKKGSGKIKTSIPQLIEDFKSKTKADISVTDATRIIAGEYKGKKTDPTFKKQFNIVASKERWDEAIRRVAQELKIDPDANEAQLAKQIYGADNIENLRHIRADVSKFSEFLVGAREVAGLKLGNYSLAQKQDLLGHIHSPGVFKFGTGTIGDRMVKVRDYLLNPSGRTLKSMLLTLKPGLGKDRIDIDEVVGRAATYEKAPGYTELGQVLKSNINQYKGKQLDVNFSRIFNQIMDGQTKDFSLDGRKYNSVEDVAKAWNRKSNAFAKDYGIHTAQLRVGKDLDPTKLVKHFDLLSPEAQKDILRVARTKGLAMETKALPLGPMADIFEARGKGIEPKSLSFYKSIVPEFSKQVYATGDKAYIKMWEDRVGCKDGCLATKPGVVGRLLQKMPKGGRTGMILAGLGAVGAGTWAMMGDATAEEAPTTDQMTYNATEGKFVDAAGDPETQEGILNWIGEHPIISGVAAVPVGMGAGLGADAMKAENVGKFFRSMKFMLPPAYAAEKLYQYKEGQDLGQMFTNPLDAVWAMALDNKASRARKWDYYKNIAQKRVGIGPLAKGAVEAEQLGFKPSSWKNIGKATMAPRSFGTSLVFPFAGPKPGAGLGMKVFRGAARLAPLGPIPMALLAGSMAWDKYKFNKKIGDHVDALRAHGVVSEEDAETMNTIYKQGWLGTTAIGAKLLGSEELMLEGELLDIEGQKRILAGMKDFYGKREETATQERVGDRQEDFFSWFSKGGRVGLAEGGNKKPFGSMTRRGFLKWLVGSIAAGVTALSGKGIKQAAKPIAKAVPKAVAKFQGVEGMPLWFPRAVAKIKAHGKLLSMADKDYVQGDMYEMMIPVTRKVLDATKRVESTPSNPAGQVWTTKTEYEKVIMEENPLTGEISMQWTGTDNFGDDAVRQINFAPGKAGYQKFGVDDPEAAAHGMKEFRRVKVEEPEFSYTQPDPSNPYRDDVEYLDIFEEGDEIVEGLEKMTGQKNIVTKDGTVMDVTDYSKGDKEVDEAFQKKIYQDVEGEGQIIPEPEGVGVSKEGDVYGEEQYNEIIEGVIPDHLKKKAEGGIIETGNIARRPGAVPPLSGPTPQGTGIVGLFSNPKRVNIA